MNDKGFRYFIFGIDKEPKWFMDKVRSKDVEYIKVGGKVVACRFYNVYTREERVIANGDIIASDMLYPGNKDV